MNESVELLIAFGAKKKKKTVRILLWIVNYFKKHEWAPGPAECQ